MSAIEDPRTFVEEHYPDMAASARDVLIGIVHARDAQIREAMEAQAAESERTADNPQTLPVFRNGHVDAARTIRELMVELFGGAS